VLGLQPTETSAQQRATSLLGFLWQQWDQYIIKLASVEQDGAWMSHQGCIGSIIACLAHAAACPKGHLVLLMVNTGASISRFTPLYPHVQVCLAA
jgi:hypothetical protein